MIIEFILLVIAGWFLLKIFKKPDAYPPGLWGVPLLGNLLAIYDLKNKSIAEIMEEQRKKHGDIVLWRIGSVINIFLFDFKQAKEALSSVDYADRPDIEVMRFTQYGKNVGIIASNGINWHSNRRFALRHLRDLGMGKSRIVASMHEEASEMIKHMKKTAGPNLQCPPKIFMHATLNIIWQLVATHRYDYEDPEIATLQKYMDGLNENFFKFAFLSFFPWTVPFIPEFVKKRYLNYESANNFRDTLNKFMNQFIEEHQKKIDYDNPVDFIDEYLAEMKTKKDDPESSMSIPDLVQSMNDFFSAGSGTSSLTMTWALFYLANNPEIQEKLYKEVDEVLPNGKFATIDERTDLNYTEAFIHETHRYCSFVYMGLMRSVSQDVKLGEYTIPKGAIVYPMSSNIHFQKAIWNDPQVFRPERFLDENKKFTNVKEGFLPFGLGKRKCLGESMARMELLVFIPALVQNFKFSPPPGKKMNCTPFATVFVNLPDEKQMMLIEPR